MYSWEIANAVKNEYITDNEIRKIMDNSPQVYRWKFDGMDETYSYQTLYTYDVGNISFRMLNYNKRGNNIGR